ncbi:PREDICTED: neuropeptide S [Thamnophis sirtalis]|uniref:Neuropeptide S n=1 Tax=Thamnophis sirtalis TaxID=35019 RepID=A0A6I9Y5K9_9SAUR|nr:PREDICTED: neuropeptide S [Thamnophis sirtalis]
MFSYSLYAVLIIWLSAMNMNGCYPIVASLRNNRLYMNCQLPRKSDCLFLLLLNGCLAKMDGSEEPALFSSFLENSDIKRSFRNGVGSGIKKNILSKSQVINSCLKKYSQSRIYKVKMDVLKIVCGA